MAPTIEARIHELVRLIVERTEARVEQAFAEAIADELDARQKGQVLSVRDEPVSPIGDTLAVRACPQVRGNEAARRVPLRCEDEGRARARKEWEKGVARMPDYRITCLFVDSGYRRAGMAAVAVRGALALIAAAGGGLVEAYPHDLPEGKKTSASFLYNATRTMYERLGFSYERSKGKGNCVMSAVVPAAT